MERLKMLKKLGDLSQIAGIREMTFSSGKGKGTCGLEVYNAAGLRFTVLPDKCLDLYDFSFKGVNLSFLSKNGMVGNKFFNALDNEFPYYWSGGALATCGLANTGPSCTDEGLFRTTHGRIGMTPAEDLCAQAEWLHDDYILAISGSMRETVLYGMNIKLHRQITASLYGKEICIRDTLENLEPKEEPYSLLYHFNFGYPLVNEGARIVKPKGAVQPRNEDAAKGLHAWEFITEPKDNEPEQVFFHENPPDKEGYSCVGIINDALNLGVYLKYTHETLPVLAQWKSLRSHDYAVGLEPCNTFVRGRKEERENGMLKTLAGYGKAETVLCLGVLEGEAEISDFRKKPGY